MRLVALMYWLTYGMYVCMYLQMRAILLHILRYFRFELAAEMAPGNPSGYDPEMMQGVRVICQEVVDCPQGPRLVRV